MSPYSAPFSFALNTTYWIIALYSLDKSSLSPRISSSLVGLDESDPMLADGELILLDM